MSTNASDTLYTLARTNDYETWWDAGGTDTISAASQAEGWVISLPNIRLSALVDTKAGFATPTSDLNLMAPTTLIWLAGDIENATGSNFSDVLIGSDAANHFVGNGGNDAIEGLGGNDVIDGGSGTDLALYEFARAQYAVNISNGAITVSGPEGADSLISVERAKFPDVGLAFDIAGPAGMTAKLLGAVFGASAVHNELYVAIGLSYFDSGWTYLQVANLALNEVLGSARSNASVFDLLYFNTVGAHADAATANYWIGQLQAGAMTQAQLATFAADMDLNLANINYVGLAATGLDYAV
jgi:serralysin